MYQVLDKDTIISEILPYLPKAKRGFITKSDRAEIIPNIAINQRNGAADENIFVDDLLYKERYCIERTNAWIDGFRTLLNRFDVTSSSCLNFNLIGFTTILLKEN